MDRFDTVIIGGGVSAVTAAETIREKNDGVSLALVSEEKEPLYSRVLLPNYLKGERERKGIFLKEKGWYQEARINVFWGRTVKELNAAERSVTLDDNRKIWFSKLLIASGSRVRRLAIPGETLGHVHYLRTVHDADQILETLRYLKTLPRAQKKVAIVGGGFIGLELASVFSAHGIQGSIVTRGPYYWSERLDNRSSTIIQSEFAHHGFTLLAEEEVEEIYGTANPEGLQLASGKRIEAYAVGLGIGIVPSFDFLEGTPIATEQAILTDEYLETSLEGVYAAGDCAQFFDPILGRRVVIGNWTNSTVHGRLSGRNMEGGRTAFGTVSAYSASYFGVDVAFVGDPRDIPDTTIIAREDGGGRAQFFLWDKRLVGATLVNTPKLRGPVTQLIKQRIRISDPSVLSSADISSLIP